MKISSVFITLLAAACVSFIHASSPPLRALSPHETSEDETNSIFHQEHGKSEEEENNTKATDLSEMLAWIFAMFYKNRREENDQDEADYIVEFDDDLDDVELIAHEIAEALGKHNAAHVFQKLLNGFTISGITQEMADKIASTPGVMRVEKDQEVVMDGELRHLEESIPFPQETPWGIERVGGGRANYDGPNVVFVVDCGLDFFHPDLNVDRTRCFTAFDDCIDRVGHGTHVAGIIGAMNNGFGTVGVAPGVTLVAVKVIGDDGQGSMSNVIRGVEWISENGKPGDVANISLSGDPNEALDKAIRKAAKLGIHFTLSAGNNAAHATDRSPARANHRNIFTICASTENDELAWFSNAGAPPVDLCAPGVGIKSTYKDGMYATMDGTSMAAPHAAGVLLYGRPRKQHKEVSDNEGNMYKVVEVNRERNDGNRNA